MHNAADSTEKRLPLAAASRASRFQKHPTRADDSLSPAAPG